MPKKDRSKILLASESKIPSWLTRYTNTIAITITWPCFILGFVYLAAFFVLNSSYGPKILHSQLSSFLRGDYWCDTMQTDAFLQKLTMTEVRLCEAGKCDHDHRDTVIYAPKVEAKPPIDELVDLITSTTLRVGRIKAYNADVKLDFTQGELNILKVVLPYFSKPEPPTPPGNFMVYLADLNVEGTAVHLIFDGFRIDLYGTEVDHYAIKAGGGVFEMNSPLARENQNVPAIRVDNGLLQFDPALFSFALSSIGDKSEGLIMSGGPGSAGKVGYAYQQMARHIESILRESPEFATKVGAAPETRGKFLIPLKTTHVDGFHWRGNEFEIPHTVSIVGDGGTLDMKHAMMNVGPTQAEIDSHSTKYRHAPSGLLPEESVLWAADLSLGLKVSDPILSYFFGPILKGDEPLALKAVMAGDLARVSGDIELDMPEFSTFGVDVSRAALRAQMDGQHLELKTFEADTALGGALVGGYYDIMDGNFDLDVWAGKAPEDPDFPYVDRAFASRLAEGLTPLDMAPDGAIQQFNGLLGAHLKASSQDGIMAVELPEPIEYKLNTPFVGIKKAVISSADPENKQILTYHNGVATSPAGLMVNLGDDHVRLAPGTRFNTNDTGDIMVDVSAHVEAPAKYAEQFGITDLKLDPLDLQASYGLCGTDTCGSLRVKTNNLSYMGIDVPKVDIDLALNNSMLTTRSLLVETTFARLNASVSGMLTPQAISDPMSAPFHAEFKLTDLDLEKFTPPIEALDVLALQGKGDGTLTVDGPVSDMKARFIYTMTDVEVMEVPISRMLLIARYEDKKILVPALNIWFDPSELSPEEAAKLDAEERARREAQAAASNHAQTETVAGNLQKLDVQNAEKIAAELSASTLANRQNQPATNGRPRVRRRTPDLSLGALTYDPDKNTIIFNVALQPTSPNKFKPFRDLEIPVEADVSFDISANADLDFLLGDAKNAKNYESTWIEGEFNLENLKYAGFDLKNTHIQFSRSKQYTLIRGKLIDTLDLGGFVRTAPHISASVSLNFPDLDILKVAADFGFDATSIIQNFELGTSRLSGSLGFCMKNLDDMTASLLIDDIYLDVHHAPLELTQPAYIRANLKDMSFTLSQFEIKYRDSVLKMSGSAGLNGDIDFDVNGEIDAAIARSFMSTVKESSGLLGVSLSARGNMFNAQKQLSLKGLTLSGYLGVRDPIQVLTSVAASPLELRRGFILMDTKHPKCAKRGFCIYTPDDQPFTLGINGEELDLKLFASDAGEVAVDLGGAVSALLIQHFVKDVSNAKGSLDLAANLSGNILDKSGGLVIDFHKFEFGGHIKVNEPIAVELRSMTEPVTLDSGILKITKGADCPNGGECIVIPKKDAFQGNLMGGNYIIFGEIVRNSLAPKSGNLSITANNVSFRMKDELSLTVSPDIQITAKDLSDFDTVKVSGNIDIAEAKYKKNFDDGSSNFIRDQILSLFIDSRKRVDTYSPSFLRKYPYLSKINLDLGVYAENSIIVDVKIATAVVKLELGSQLKIGGTIKEFAPTGIFSINSGVFTLRNNDFEFQNGAQVAFNGSLDGKIDVIATTEISTSADAFSAVTGSTDLDRRKRISSSNANASSDLYSITLTVGGTVFRPVWGFESSPYLTDTNVYALILTGKTIEDFSGNDVAMESLLSPLFSSQLDAIVKADQFKFKFSEGAAQFIYAKQINKALRIAAGVSIRGSEGNEQALSGEYYFNDRWFIDLTGQNTSDEEGRAPTFKLGARLHWHLPIE
ncbi:MAG: translocation/assembly module TamB domain-containing protein [Proteobacteria bacterium]|nr:translocation/assembly module TamB domain-containing protein [Pseudomonadota bacterium]